MLSLYQSTKIILGLTTALPMISFGITNLTNGNGGFGIFLIVFGAIAYYFPTWILEKYTKQLKKKKEKISPF